MSFLIKRLEKNIARCEKEIEKTRKKIEELERDYKANKITKAKFNIKKRKYEDRINALNARIRVIRGGIVREKKREEEKKEKEKK
ncbi:hypothetical protein B6U70_01530 [Euryarchaeota archaeon ex4484_162]|nr:hypothetical protein [Thermoplasmata archaeon]OYT57994.1 MAG: hypothetical protein B6U70_01530 [Euryarchaeota archaeon ex4484_162]HDM25373.1 hypothetical protein [Thermoplasmatales archaeon]